MHSPRFPPHLALLALVLPSALLPSALLTGACSAPSAQPAGDTVGLEELPQLEVAGPDPTVQQQIAEARHEVDRLSSSIAGDAEALGSAYGRLGMVYNVYQELDAAQIAYRNATKLAPDEPRWPYYLAFIHQLRGELTEAKALYERVLTLTRGDAVTLLRLAEVHLEADRPKEAGELLAHALELRPDSAAAHFGLGRVAAAEARHGDAAEHFERALELQPEALQVHYPLAQALRNDGDEDGARRHLELRGETEVAIADPRLAEMAALGRGRELHHLRGEVALAEERCGEAAASFRRALALAPGDSGARAGLATALRDCGDLAGAIDQLLLSTLTAPAIETAGDPTTPEAFILPTPPDLSRLDAPSRRRLQTLQGQAREALAAGNHHQIATFLGQLGQLYLAYGLNDAAERHFVAARQLLPGEPSWGYYLAVLTQNRQPERSRRHLQDFVAERPGDLPAWIRLGQVELELDERSAAGAAFRRALEIEPGSAAALFGLGRVQLARGDATAAVPLLRRALAEQPEAGRVHHVLGQALRRTDVEAARAHLEQASDRDVVFEDPLIDRLGDVQTLTAFEVVLAMAADPEVRAEDHLGFALSKLGGVQGAAEQLTAALAQPGDASAAGRARLAYVAGGLWVRRSEDARAIPLFRDAVRLDPELLDARVKLGNALARQGELAEAVDAYSAVLEREADHPAALAKRATARASLGDLAGATADLERLVLRAPGDPTARLRLAAVLGHAGRYEEALVHYARLLSLEPGHLEGRLGQATGLVLLGRYDEARRGLEDGLRHAPSQPHLAHFLARLLAIAPATEARDGERAVELALEVFQQQATPRAAQTVAMALAAAGRFDEASTWQRRLIDEAGQRQDARWTESLRPQLAAYEAGQPWRATSPDQLIVLPSAG